MVKRVRKIDRKLVEVYMKGKGSRGGFDSGGGAEVNERCARQLPDRGSHALGNFMSFRSKSTTTYFISSIERERR